jgi:uncharacterized protein (TIGR02246 family)
MISSGPIEDRLAIRELIESYNDAVMRFDADAWGANWADDGTWSLPGRDEVHGREAIVAQWVGAMSTMAVDGFFASAGPIVVDGDRAHATWYQQELLRPNAGGKLSIVGEYTDDYVRSDGRWYIYKRVYHVRTLTRQA